MLNEAMRWANAIQGAIDSKVPIETPTQQLIRDIKVLNYSLECYSVVIRLLLSCLLIRDYLILCV